MNYYNEKLNSQKLFQVYRSDIPRVRQYLDAEIEFVRHALKGTERVLELGAGYGRIMRALAPYCASITGIDVSMQSVELGREYLADFPQAGIQCMDARHLTLSEQFDVLLCLQNGLSAMRLSQQDLGNLLARLASGGTAYFSTYSANFWEIRLAWFQEQADKGLLGPIDWSLTKDGVIVCQDGFRATTQTPDDLGQIGEASGYPYEIKEVDGSSLFLIIHKQ